MPGRGSAIARARMAADDRAAGRARRRPGARLHLRAPAGRSRRRQAPIDVLGGAPRPGGAPARAAARRIEPPPDHHRGVPAGRVRPEDFSPATTSSSGQRASRSRPAGSSTRRRQLPAERGRGDRRQEPPTTRAGSWRSVTVTEAMASWPRGLRRRPPPRRRGPRLRTCGDVHDTEESRSTVRPVRGPSDPADEAIVLALRCPAAAPGRARVAFGPDADPALAEASPRPAVTAEHRRSALA